MVEPLEIIDLLCSVYGKRALESDGFRMRPPFEHLISTVLSQQTTAHNCELATVRLFSRYSTPEEIASADIEELEDLVHPSGYYRMKARAVRDISVQLVERFGGKVPDNMCDLMSLPKVGSKTAACVMMYGFGRPAMIVDTHIHRVSNRLGFVHTRNASETEKALSELFPDSRWKDVDLALLSLGHECCHARNPDCAGCPVRGDCVNRSGQ